MGGNKNDKTKISKKEIERLEGRFEDCFKATATTFEQAEQIIKLMSQTAPELAYDKTGFTITWEDDSKYKGRNVTIIMALRDSIKFYKDRDYPKDFIQDVKEILDVLKDTSNYNYSNFNRQKEVTR